ncbi:MAG TPA: hypothetical protein VJW51_12740 [Candidatus Acidoferrales bacterium]|nr:hypothetical protein [Candidatus Acidoferrales bacterium]
MSNLIPAHSKPHLAAGQSRRPGRGASLSRRMAAAALFALLWPGVPATQSTTLARMELRELALRAPYVARVRCVQAVSWADASLVWSLTSFEVIEAWKGNPPPKFTVRLPGGESAGKRVTVEGAPRFAVGEDAVLFLEPERGLQLNIVSWAQGTFRIRRNPRTGAEEATQDTAGLQILDARTGKSSEGERRRLTVAQLRAGVARAVAESKR